MRGHKRDGDFSAGQKHGEILHATALRKKFRLAGKGKPDFIHAGLVDRTGHDRVNLARAGERNCLLQRGQSRASRFDRWLA